METTKMTKREMYQLIADTMSDNTDVVAFCNKEIAALDARALKAKERAEVKKTEVDELGEVVRSVLTHDAQTLADICAQIEGDDVSTQKITSRLTKLAAAGVVVKSDVKIPATETSKARTVRGYALAD